MSWVFLASCVLSRGTSASPLATRQNSPGIWTLRRCPKKNTIYMTNRNRFSFRPLSTTSYNTLLRASTVGNRTLACRQGPGFVAPARSSMDEPTRREVKRGILCGKVRVSIFTAASHRNTDSPFFPCQSTLPPSTNTTPFQPLYATPACRNKVLHGVQRAGSGEGQKGGEYETKCTVRIVISLQ